MSQDIEEPSWVQPGVVEDENDQSGSVGWTFADQQFGAFVFVVASIVAVVLLITMFLREFYWRKYGVDICPSYRAGLGGRRRRRQQIEQMDADRAMAEDLQRRLNEEEREAERLAKRKERRAWFEIYIKDYTMTATAEDLFYAHEVEDVESTEKSDVLLPTGAGTTRALKNLSSISISDDEEIDDIESGPVLENVVEPVACDASEEDAHLFLRLPVKDCCGKFRTVDAHCAICCSEYEEGHKVVWSGLQCQHAFHDECILPWLSKGKKRCPICRNWFVPGTRIEDQKKEIEQRLRLESSDENGDSVTTIETEPFPFSSDGEYSSAEIESAESDTQISAEAVETIASTSLDLEAEIVSTRDLVDDSSSCHPRDHCDADDKEISSQDFGIESEELTESRGLGALENV